MTDLSDHDDDETLDDNPALAGVRRFGNYIARVPWFIRLGRKVGPNLRRASLDYLTAMGFPEVDIAPIISWQDAADAAMNPDWNCEFWETEEQLRAGLTIRAQDALGEAALEVAMTWIASCAGEVILPMADAIAPPDDGELAAALAGHASQACHQAALVLAAGAETDHPFALKFRLFEAGRWPIGVTGGSFNLF